MTHDKPRGRERRGWGVGGEERIRIQA